MPKRELTKQEKELRVRLGVQIRVLSEACGIKPTDLAAETGVSLAQQYRIEKGELTADFLYLAKVATLLGTSVDALLTGTPSLVPTPDESTMLANYRASAPEDKAALKAQSGQGGAAFKKPVKRAA